MWLFWFLSKLKTQSVCSLAYNSLAKPFPKVGLSLSHANSQKQHNEDKDLVEIHVRLGNKTGYVAGAIETERLMTHWTGSWCFYIHHQQRGFCLKGNFCVAEISWNKFWYKSLSVIHGKANVSFKTCQAMWNKMFVISY